MVAIFDSEAIANPKVGQTLLAALMSLPRFNKHLFTGTEIRHLLEAGGVSVTDLAEAIERVEAKNPDREKTLRHAIRESLPRNDSAKDRVLLFFIYGCAGFEENGGAYAVYPDNSGFHYSLAYHPDAEAWLIRDPNTQLHRTFYRLSVPASANFFEAVRTLWPRVDERYE